MKRILLVEDTSHLSEEIADILRLEGYLVASANNGFTRSGAFAFGPDLT